MANMETGEVRRWDSLTDKEKKSGKWIQIPDGTEGGFAREAGAQKIIDELFPPKSDKRMRDDVQRAIGQRGFDATGKAR